MKRLLLVLTLLLTAVWAAPAPAAVKSVFIATDRNSGIQPPPSTCPYPVDNGCLNAPQAVAASASTFNPTARLPGDLLNQLSATTTDYTTSYVEDTNRPGIDYPVGETAYPVFMLKDPASATLPAGCSYNPTGNTSGGPLVTCNVSTGFSGQTLDGFSFDSTGLHHCVALLITGTSLGSVSTVSQNLFRNGTADCTVTTNAPEQVQDNASLSTVHFVSDTFDGNSLALPATIWQAYSGNCSVAANINCNPGAQAFIATGTVTFEYISQLNYFARPDQYNGPGDGISITHSYQQGCCSTDPAAHAEMYEFAPSSGSVVLNNTIDGNTILITTSHDNTGLSLWPANFNASAGGVIANQSFSNNFYIPAFGGGAGLSISVDNTSTVQGSVFTAGNVTGTANPATGGQLGGGPLFSCNTTGSNLNVAIFYAGLTGTTSAGPGGGGFGGTGSNWQMDLNGSSGATITSFIDDGANYPLPDPGHPGNVLSITANTSMNVLNANGVTVSGHNVLSTNNSTGNGGNGGVGQYNVDGSASVVAPGVVAATPSGTQHGLWDIPPGVLLHCAANNTIAPVPFQWAINDDFSPMFTQITRSGNVMDLSVYSSNPDLWSQRTNNTHYGAHITGTALTIDGIGGITITNVGTGYSSATASFSGGTGGTSLPTATLTTSSGKVGTSPTITFPGTGYTVTPNITISAPQGGTFTGSVTANVLTVSTTPTLSVKLVPTVTQLTSLSGSPVVGTQLTGTTGGTGTYNLTHANVVSSTITASGVQATGTTTLVSGQSIDIHQLVLGTGVAANTFIVSGSGLIWTVSPSQTVSETVMSNISTWCQNSTDWGAGAGTNIDVSGTHTSGQMNAYVAPIPGNGC